MRLLATAYGARASLAGVVRQDDVDAGRDGENLPPIPAPNATPI